MNGGKYWRNLVTVRLVVWYGIGEAISRSFWTEAINHWKQSLHFISNGPDDSIRSNVIPGDVQCACPKYPKYPLSPLTTKDSPNHERHDIHVKVHELTLLKVFLLAETRVGVIYHLKTLNPARHHSPLWSCFSILLFLEFGFSFVLAFTIYIYDHMGRVVLCKD